MEFENDQANQNCHGKKFYSKEDTSVSTHSVSEANDPLGSSFTKRYSNNFSDRDQELAILSQSLIDNDSSERQTRVKENKSHEQNNLGKEEIWQAVGVWEEHKSNVNEMNVNRSKYWNFCDFYLGWVLSNTIVKNVFKL